MGSSVLRLAGPTAQRRLRSGSARGHRSDRGDPAKALSLCPRCRSQRQFVARQARFIVVFQPAPRPVGLSSPIGTLPTARLFPAGRRGCTPCPVDTIAAGGASLPVRSEDRTLGEEWY